MSDRAHGFVAGLLLGILMVAVVLSVIACKTVMDGRPANAWQILQPGVTTIQTPCAIVVIEVRQGGTDGCLYWRIAVLRPPSLPPEPPPPKEQKASLRR